MAKPFYGVDGNLLVEDLPHGFETVEKILNGRFKPTFWAEQFLPSYLMTRYPQLKDERAKRKHRREYHARLRQRSCGKSARRVLWEPGAGDRLR
jgi:hypothetical protein